ncbi:MAG: hypothetical protein NUV57_01065 [archaeon]|nr:hypothetical protein [archaeon]
MVPNPKRSEHFIKTGKIVDAFAKELKLDKKLVPKPDQISTIVEVHRIFGSSVFVMATPAVKLKWLADLMSRTVDYPGIQSFVEKYRDNLIRSYKHGELDQKE